MLRKVRRTRSTSLWLGGGKIFVIDAIGHQGVVCRWATSVFYGSLQPASDNYRATNVLPLAIHGNWNQNTLLDSKGKPD
jgi:hypothetical protein